MIHMTWSINFEIEWEIFPQLNFDLEVNPYIVINCDVGSIGSNVGQLVGGPQSHNTMCFTPAY